MHQLGRKRRSSDEQTVLESDILHSRFKLAFCILCFSLTLVVSRLFYWQVVKGATLSSQATNQYQRTFTKTGHRGDILSFESYPLVSNEEVYRVFAQPSELTSKPEQIATALTSLIVEEDRVYLEASGAAEKKHRESQVYTTLLEKLSDTEAKWVNVYQPISQNIKEKIATLDFHGVGFDPYQKRWYPEATMAAAITGFVGKNDIGEDTGYFGIEGALNKELMARNNTATILADALGFELFSNEDKKQPIIDGRSIRTTIRRDIQYLVWQALEEGIQKYGASAGEIIVLNPKTGEILGLAAAPTYDPRTFSEYDPQLYKNPSLTAAYEPGSTFKVLTVAAGIDSAEITKETTCPVCAGPRVFGKYTIKTWNDVYNPNITMEQGLAKSDNTAMIYIAEKLGPDRFKKYLQAFKIGEEIHLDMQEDTSTPFPPKMGPVELATISFGQGISITSMQLVRAISAIANNGTMMQPHIVASVTDPHSDTEVSVEPTQISQVVSPQTAKTVTEMMVTAAEGGEAQWVASKKYTIAGKTGTSQIPSQDGGYKEDATIASFIGFAPAHDPAFVLFVKLVEPTSSIWAAETAAPLWYSVANDLFIHLGIPPDKIEQKE